MKYKSDIFEVIHESAVAKFEIGAIPKERMREYDEMCLADESDSSAILETENKQHLEFVAV